MSLYCTASIRHAEVPFAAGGRAAIALFLVAVVCLYLVGCARQAPLSDLEESGAVVWVRLTTSEDERVVGQLVSLDAASMTVAVRHELGDDVRVRERGERALYSGTERLPGDFVRVERDEGRPVAVVHRTFLAGDVATATFHESSGERSLASIISLLLGPVVGAALGLVL
jgi:hypothetical protein